jgi:GTP cyclohydrolase II
MHPAPAPFPDSPAALCAAALGLGEAIRLAGEDYSYMACAAELPPPGGKSAWEDSFLVISAERAQALGLATHEPAAFALRGMEDALLHALIDPTLPAPALWPSPAHVDARYAPLLSLARHGGLLPALRVRHGAAEPALTLGSQALTAFLSPGTIALTHTAEAPLPLEGAPSTVAHSFRETASGATHLALVIGQLDVEHTPLVRVHSSCVTGDILGSLRCDCGDQLALAIRHIAQEGRGIVLYLHQEGRGIGIANKLRAYALQDKGIDTFMANRLLGFAADERDFAVAAAMLRALQVHKVRLLTNNPAKLGALQAHGLAIEERVALVAGAGEHNAAYLSAKRSAGHQL